MKTNELIGSALDWAVAKCEGQSFTYGDSEYKIDGRVFQRGGCSIERRYSTDWAQGGPIIEREMMDIVPFGNPSKGVHWRAGGTWTGPTPLIAGMRCYVASKMGDDVDIPEELI
jgi:hypothetical protein